MKSDPPRLLDPGSATPEVLQRVLGSAASDAPSASQLASLQGRLGPLLGAPATVGPTAAGAKGAGFKVLVAFVVGSGVAGLGAALWLDAAPPEGLPAPGPSPTLVVVRPATPPPPPPAPDPVTTEPSRAAPAPRRRASRPRASIKAEAPPAPAIDEAELLARALAALRQGDAERALELASEHERSFVSADGLAQEREAIAIEALARSGRHQDARRRFDAFETIYPQSGYRWRLRALLGEWKP
jgi:hypothetical protein